MRNLLYEDDSEDEAAIDMGNFKLLPFTKQTKADYVPRMEARKKVRKEVDIVENQYGRCSPELYISISISETAIEKAQTKVDLTKKKLLLLNDKSLLEEKKEGNSTVEDVSHLNRESQQNRRQQTNLSERKYA